MSHLKTFMAYYQTRKRTKTTIHGLDKNVRDLSTLDFSN